LEKVADFSEEETAAIKRAPASLRVRLGCGAKLAKALR